MFFLKNFVTIWLAKQLLRYSCESSGGGRLHEAGSAKNASQDVRDSKKRCNCVDDRGYVVYLYEVS